MKSRSRFPKPTSSVKQARRQFATMPDFLVSRLKDSILNGSLKPGARLSERSITEDWGISKTPVREALSRLEAQGWVEIHPFKGAIISPLSVEELEEIYLIRIALEGLAGRLATENMDSITRKSLNAIVAQMAALGGSSRDTMMDLNRKFHDTFYARSNRPRLCSLIADYQDKSYRYRRLLQGFSNTHARIIGQRRAILRACARGESGVVERLIRKNLVQNLDRLQKYMSAT